MKVKMTRTERAIRKAQKAAKTAYKLGKAPTFYEFTNPVDLMTKEEKFQWDRLDGELHWDYDLS